MKIKNIHHDSPTSFRIITGSLLLALLLNLDGFQEWARSKEVSTFTVYLVKLAEAMNAFGERQTYNHARKFVRSEFMLWRNQAPAETMEAGNFSESLTQPTADLGNIKSNSSQSSAQASLGPHAKRSPLLLPVMKITRSATTEARVPAAVQAVEPVKVIPPTLPSARNIANRVLVLGDSMLKSGIQVHIKNYFSKKYPQVEIEIDSQSGTGLARPEVFNWIKRVKEKAARYDYVVVMLGTNDAQNFSMGRKVIPFGSSEWDQEYQERVRELMSLACEKSNKVMWVGNILMRSEKFNDRMKHLHAVAKEALPKASCSEYISPNHWLSEDDKYVDHIIIKKKNGLVKSIKVRNDDGIHLSFEGAELFARKLIEKVSYEAN